MLKYIPIRSLNSLLSLIAYLFFCNTIQAEDSIQVIRIQITELANFYTDNQSDIYVLTKDNHILKYNNKGEQIFRYKEGRNGQAGLFDLNSSNKILVQYPSSGTITLLNKNLADPKEINLRALDFHDVTAAGFAGDNNIWIYDADKSKLFKIDSTGKVLRKSNELIGLIGNNILQGQIWEQEKFLFVHSPGLGWIQFDDTGSFIQLIPIPDQDIIRMEGDKIWYLLDGEVIQFDLSTLRKKVYPIPDMLGKYDQIDQRPNIWVKSLGNEIVIYKQ